MFYMLDSPMCESLETRLEYEILATIIFSFLPVSRFRLAFRVCFVSVMLELRQSLSEYCEYDLKVEALHVSACSQIHLEQLVHESRLSLSERERMRQIF